MHAKVLTSTSSASAKKLLAGESWEEFCERLKQLGKLVQSDDVPETDIERSEGYRICSPRSLKQSTFRCTSRT